MALTIIIAIIIAVVALRASPAGNRLSGNSTTKAASEKSRATVQE